MKQTTLSAQEVAELDASKQVDARKSGYKLMSVRDQGSTLLSNGSRVYWHIPKPQEYTHYRSVPPGTFEIDGKLFDAEELSKYLRWS